jgi:IS5 family transposase
LDIYRRGYNRVVFGTIKREIFRGSAVEAVMGRMKSDRHRGRNHLKGRHGNYANPILTAIGYDFHLVLKWLRALLRIILAAPIRLSPRNQPSIPPANAGFV